MHVSHPYRIRKPSRTFIWGSYRSQRVGGGGESKHSVISNQSQNRIQNFIFSDLLQNSKFGSQPTGNREKNSSIGMKFERDTSCSVLTATERRRLDLVR